MIFTRPSARCRKGQGLAEYGLIIGLIAVICIASLNATGGSIKGLLELCHTAAAGGTGDGCTGMDCGSQSCVLTCPCTPNRPHCHDPSCN